MPALLGGSRTADIQGDIIHWPTNTTLCFSLTQVPHSGLLSFPPLSPVVVLSPSPLARQMPSRKRSPPRHHEPSAWGAHTPWQVF